ncbi:hypothetical protein TNCV_5132441 [Trichonephila clavipes]|nr:hypothetical protein TNCV_5132441 [Trichonephila clavipes]
MPLRRNRRQYEQLTDFDRGRIIGLREAEGQDVPRNTNDREDRAIRRVATSAPTTSLASIQRPLPPSRHPVPSRETIRRRLTEVGLRSRRPLRRLPLTHIIGSVDWILPTSGNLECDRLETCHLR